MTALTRRTRRLEDRFGTADGRPQILVTICNSGWGQPLEMDACIAILRECGFLSTGPGVSLVDFGCLPRGLNAEELERFLREHGADLSGSGRAKRDGLISANPTLGGSGQ